MPNGGVVQHFSISASANNELVVSFSQDPLEGRIHLPLMFNVIICISDKYMTRKTNTGYPSLNIEKQPKFAGLQPSAVSFY